VEAFQLRYQFPKPRYERSSGVEFPDKGFVLFKVLLSLLAILFLGAPKPEACWSSRG